MITLLSKVINTVKIKIYPYFALTHTHTKREQNKLLYILSHGEQNRIQNKIFFPWFLPYTEESFPNSTKFCQNWLILSLAIFFAPLQLLVPDKDIQLPENNTEIKRKEEKNPGYIFFLKLLTQVTSTLSLRNDEIIRNIKFKPIIYIKVNEISILLGL